MFLKRMRWKAFFAETEEDRNEKKETFGFKTAKTPPQHEQLNAFEDDMYELMRSVEFSNKRSIFQQKLSEDTSKLCDSGKVVVPADKTTNMYVMPPAYYEKLLRTMSLKPTNKREQRHLKKSTTNQQHLHVLWS